MSPIRPLAAVLALLPGPLNAQNTPDLRPFSSGGVGVRVELVAEGLGVPAALAFLPDGRLLVADRAGGRLLALDVASGEAFGVAGLPEVDTLGDGGLHDVVAHPDFTRNGVLFIAYSTRRDTLRTTAVDRARLVDGRLADVQRIFTAQPFLPGPDHFGGRLAYVDGHLFITVGDRQHRDLAQDMRTHIGKIVRIRQDGGIPDDNPFAGRADALPGIWSLGHRNPQGLAWDARAERLWTSEHGPRGGDEINLVVAGANYGWPVLSFGFEYAGGPIGEGVPTRDGFQAPVHVYVPSIAPSGMILYEGAAFAAWRGSLLLGALALRHLNRVEVEEGRFRLEERMLDGRGWRVRAIASDAAGLIYIGTDDGRVLRLRPAPAS